MLVRGWLPLLVQCLHGRVRISHLPNDLSTRVGVQYAGSRLPQPAPPSRRALQLPRSIVWPQLRTADRLP